MSRDVSLTPPLEAVYHSQDNAEDLLEQYGGVSLSQGSASAGGWSPPTPRSARSRSRNPSLSSPHRSPQRSPHPSHSPQQAPHPPQHAPHSQGHPSHSPQHTPHFAAVNFASRGGYTTGGNVLSTSWDNIAAAVGGDDEEEEVHIPSSAAEIMECLKQQVAILSGGRDRQGQSLITFPAKDKEFTYDRENIWRVVQYLARIPTEDVREYGFSVIVDARVSNWHNTKLILRTLQEALPGQIHVVYIVQPGHFWKKQATSRGHSKEKSKLEFSTVMLSAVEKLIRHVDTRQLTSDLGGFLPYDHEEWIKLRLDLEHFISSFNALMEHTAHVEQQLGVDQDPSNVETSEEVLARHVQMQDQLRKAPQSTIREGNDLLRQVEQGRDEAGTSSMTPDKINAIAIIKRLLENINRRQLHLEDQWRERKAYLEQTLQLRVFEKAVMKVRNWLKARGEEVVLTRSDIGDSVETAEAIQEQHDKFESKARNMYSNLTQLRRMADRFTGTNHFAAESLQRQVSKLSSKFSKFETLLAERRSIVHGSVRLHSSTHEWWGHSEKTTILLKRDSLASDLTTAELLLGDHNEMMLQLGEMGDTIVREARSLLEQMESITPRTMENRGTGGSRNGLDYSAGIDHVRRLLDEVEHCRIRTDQLAEAKKLRLEQFKQLYSCEKDAKQVTQWLLDMWQQMAASHGDIGDSKLAIEHLLNEHEKFSETAKKTFKYGCDLLSAAQRTRIACKLDSQPNSAHLGELNVAWERLSGGVTESRARLEIAQQFHYISDEVNTCYSLWTTPIQKLQKSPQTIEERLRDIANNKDTLGYRMDECIRTGNSLLDRMCHPLSPDPVFHTLNSNTKRSLTYLRAKLEELERKRAGVNTTLAKQEDMLRDFLTYCEFEQSIEQVLVWLQEEGLKRIQSFSHPGETQSVILSQVKEFQVFNDSCKELSHQVERLHSEAPRVESQIQGFRSDLGRKTSSLRAVWEKFLQRVENRSEMLHMAASFYDGVGKLQDILGNLEAALRPEVVTSRAKGVRSYLSELGPKREQALSLYAALVKVGGSLGEKLKRPPSDPTERPTTGTKVDNVMKILKIQNHHVEELWQNAQRLVIPEKQQPRPPQNEPFKSAVRLEPFGKPPVVKASPVSGGKEVKASSVSGGKEVRASPVSGGKEVKASSVSGGKEVKASSVSGGKEVKASSVSGGKEVKASSVSGGKEVKASSVSGGKEVKASSVSGGKEVKASSVSGGKEIKASSVSGGKEVKASSVSGGKEIKASSVSGGKEVKASSVSGGKEVRASPVSGGKEVKASSVSGGKEVKASSVSGGKEVKPVSGGKEERRYQQLETQAIKHLEWLESECDHFLSRHAQVDDTIEEAEKMKAELEKFQESIQPTSSELTQSVKSLLTLKSEVPSLSSAVDKRCENVRTRVERIRTTIQARWEILQMFITFSAIAQEASSHIQSLDDFLCQPADTTVSMETTQKLLDKYHPIAKSLKKIYPNAKSLGEKFLEVTTQLLLAETKGPRLSVGDACTSVAVELGELEGKYPDIVKRWGERERSLRQDVEWQSFKLNCDQISSWLKDSAEMFLQSRVELGTSLETAEDLLMEHEEFQVRSKRTAKEVESLLAQSDEMLADNHYASSELKDRVWELKKLHSSLQSRVETRKKALRDAVEFYGNAEHLGDDMDKAVDLCKDVIDELPSNLKIASVSSRLTNIQHEGDQICQIIGVRPVTRSKKKGKLTRSDSATATDLSIKQTLAGLQSKFVQYKNAMERRVISPSARTPKVEQPRRGTTNKFETKLNPVKKTTESKPPRVPEKRAEVRHHTGVGSVKTSPSLTTKKAGSKLPSAIPVKTTGSKPPSAIPVKTTGSKPPSAIPVKATGSKPTSPVKTTGSKPPSAIPVKTTESKPPSAIPVKTTGSKPTSPVKTTGFKPTSAIPVKTTESKPTSPVKTTGSKPTSPVKTTESKPPSAIPVKTTGSKPTSPVKTTGSKPTSAIPVKTTGSKPPVIQVEKVRVRQLEAAPPPKSTRTAVEMGRFKKYHSSSVRERAAAFANREESPQKDVPKSPERRPVPKPPKREPVPKRESGHIVPKASETLPMSRTPEKPATKQVVLQDSREASTSGSPEFYTDLQINFPPRRLKQKAVFVSTASKDVDPAFPTPRKRRSSSSSYIIRSPEPDEPRQRAYTSPTVCKTTIKHSPPVKKVSLIHINVSSQKEGSPGPSTTVSRTMVVSPTSKKPPTGKLDHSSRGRTEQRRSIQALKDSGKVKSLRNVFNKNAETMTVMEESVNEELVPPPPPIRSPDITPKEVTLNEVDCDGVTTGGNESTAVSEGEITVAHMAKEEALIPLSMIRDADEVLSQARDTPVKEQPMRPELPELTPEYAPLRPPSPMGYYLERLSSSSEFDSDSDVFESTATASSSDADDEMTEEVDYGGDSSFKEKRILRSMSVVLVDLLKSELGHLQSLETLVQVYLPAFEDEHVPTFLQGRRNAIFSNVKEIFEFQRGFYSELSRAEGSIESVCRCFTQNGPSLLCYVPYIRNMPRGLKILSQYGGTFFEDKQYELGDPLSLSNHYTSPRDRLLQYDHLLKDLIVCAQKEYLHGVSVIKDALRAVQQVMRATDNAISVSKLRGFPYSLDESRVVRVDPFNVYAAHKRKKVRELHVFLHKDYIIFSQTQYNEATDITTLAYVDSLQTAKTQLVETYKGRKDKFALSEGPSSSSKFYVLQPVSRDMVMKQLWIHTINSVLQREVKDQLVPVGEEFHPLPTSFRSEEPQKDATSWFSSLRRKHSFKGQDSIKRSGSLKRSSSLKRSGSLKRKSSVKDREVVKKKEIETVFKRKDSKKSPSKREHRSRGSSSSDTIPPAGITSIQLGTLAAGQFRAPEPEEDDDTYVVVEDFSIDREGFLSVTRGQLVEVLDQEGSNWLVCTLPMPGQLETEGFLPAHCLRPAGQAGFSHPVSQVSDGHASIPSGLRISDHSTERVPSGVSSQSEAKSQPRSHSEFVSQLVDDVYYAKQDYHSNKGGVSLWSGQAVEVLDISNGTWWLVKTFDSITGKPLEGLVPASCLVPTPPVEKYEAETGQEVSTNVMVQPSALFGIGNYEPPKSLLLAEPCAVMMSLSDDQFHSERREDSQDLLSTTEGSQELVNVFGSHPRVDSLKRQHQHERMNHYHPETSISDEHVSMGHAFNGEPLSGSIRSLPATLNPVEPLTKPPQVYLGYNPMEIPTSTLSQPELVPTIRVDTVEKLEAMEELRKLQEATVKGTPSTDKLDDFDPVEVYVAIADFDATEESNISLRGGQHVQVLDTSRPDWWLVMLTDTNEEGWVPASYLEQRVIDGPSSPPPEPFEDETGELARVMEKIRRPSDITVNRRQLYKSPFLTSPGTSGPELPSDAQLQGVFSIEYPYLAVTEVQAERPGQLSLIQNQPVHVIDSKRDDWWLVRTMREDSLPPIEGWVPARRLQPAPYIREDSVEPQAAAVISPSSPPQWVVLANYRATESGMLSVNEGELVEVIDTSRNEWCLVRTNTREPMEGWVPAAYLRPYDIEGYAHPSMLPPRFRPHSPDDSDTSTDISEPSVTCTSPEAVLRPYEEEDKREEARQQRQYVLSELANSEREYVGKLQYCIENYVAAVEDPSAPRALKTLSDSLYGNLSEIYHFHKDRFLPKLEVCELNPQDLGDTFVSAEADLLLYVVYCKNKCRSESVYREFITFFEEVRSQLKDRRELPDYLILPVQRITKYSLLLQDFHKYSVRAGLDEGDIESALDVTRGISTRANNAVHLSMMEGTERKAYGELVLQDVFAIQESLKQTFKERRVFLFDRAFVVTKKRRETDKESYTVKEQLMLTDISITQDMDSLKRNIIIYDMLNGTKFILRAPKKSVRDNWLTLSNLLIRTAKKEAAEVQTRARSASEPSSMEFFLSRSPSLTRRSMFRREREGSKRKSLRRPHSSTGARTPSPSPEIMEPPGTQYVVMECIVMEGGDDVQLEPGDMVELVKRAGVESLKVRTMDEHRVEGTVPESYLRRRDSVRGIKMEAIPKFTMSPSDMTQMHGSTATISAAFNGYPVPAIIWRRDGKMVASEGRFKITSCATSSVLEIIQLQYEDTGVYTCCLSNSMGSEDGSMMLTIQGPPSQPAKPSVSRVTSSSVKLKWPIPEYDGESPILSYQVELLQEGFDEWQPIVQQPKNNFVVKTLEPNKSYRFRVIAYNDFGASKPSETSELVSTKGKGWLMVTSPVAKKRHPDDPRDFTDAPYDPDLEEGGSANVSPKPQYIRRGSIQTLYDILPEEIGRGRYGIIHKCVNRTTRTELAVKYVRLRSKKKVEIRREVEMLLKVTRQSPNIIEFHDAFEKGRNLIIVTELVPDGELIERIIADNSLTEGVAVGYLTQLLSALECLHQLNIAHLDIKPENILLSGVEKPEVKLIDFGTARELGSDVGAVSASSPEFCAPEVVKQDTPCLASDMWSVGVLTYVLLSGISPFFVDNIQTVVERIKEARYDFYSDQFEQISQEAKDFIAALLQKSQEYRMNATQALHHSWIKMLRRVAGGFASPWPMARLDITCLKAFNARRKWHTTAVATDVSTVFGPRSALITSPVTLKFEGDEGLSAPQLWDGPSHLQAPVGSEVSFQFLLSGSPEPSVVWEYGDRKIPPSGRVIVKTEGGVTSLMITEVLRSDEGSYVCCALNGLGSAIMECHLTVLDKPGPPTDVNGVILGSYNSALISWLRPTKDGNSTITSYILERRRIEVDSWELVAMEIESAAHVVEDLLPSVSYVFRVSAVNEVGVGAHSKPSAPVLLLNEPEYDSDSPSLLDDIRIKTSPFKMEYIFGREIARGTYSTVRKCTENTTDRVFAAKIISNTTIEQKALGLYEYEMHRQLIHPRIVAMEDAFESDQNTILVMEFMPGGTLHSYLQEHHIMTEQDASRFLRKVVEGLQYLHDMKIIHVNLRPDNILLTAGHSDLKITDFGMARYIEAGNQLEEAPDSPEFMAPEVVQLQPLTTAADIWSVGAIAYLMLTGKSAFAGPTRSATLSNVYSVQLVTESEEFWNLSPNCKDFLMDRVLVKNPRRRLTASQCQRHRWLQSVSSSGLAGRRLSQDRVLEPSLHKHQPASQD